MADKKNTQTAPAGLPRRFDLSIQEAATEWSKMTAPPVSIEDILHLGVMGKIKIFVRCVSLRDETGKPLYVPEESKCICEDVLQGTLHEALALGYGHHQSFTLNTLGRFEIKDLIISMDDYIEFNEAHGLGKPAAMPAINEDTELKRAYRALGALAMQVAKQTTRYMNGNNPHISNIAAYAIDAISDEHGNTLRGYGQTSTEDAIKNALTLVKKESEESKRPSK